MKILKPQYRAGLVKLATATLAALGLRDNQDLPANTSQLSAGYVVSAPWCSAHKHRAHAVPCH